MLTIFLAILGVAFLLGFSILVHEFGHFVAAKLSGVGVEVFAIGFGPRVWSKKWRGTEYAFNWVPFGGYVKMTGMLLDELGEEKPAEKDQAEQQPKEEKESSMISEKAMGDDPLSDMAALRNKPLPIKIMIFAAGCFFNYLTAIVIFSLMFFIGYARPKPIDSFIGPIPAGSSLAALGFSQGDHVTKLGEKGIKTWDDIEREANLWAAANKGTSIPLTLERPSGESHLVELPPLEKWSGDKVIGRFFRPPIKPFIDRMIPHQAAYKAGLKEGDIITAINGQGIDFAVEATTIIENNGDVEMEFTYLRNGETLLTRLKPRQATDPEEDHRNIIGIYFGNAEKTITKYGPLKSITTGFTQANYYVVLYPRELVKVFSGGFKHIQANVGGPLMIMNFAYIQAKKGLQDYLFFFAVINLILMIMNLLPIPVLDGGHIVLATIESIIRRPVPEKVLIPVFNVFFLLLIALLVLFTFNDVFTIFIQK